MFASVPSQVAPAGTMSLWYLPEASVPVHVELECAARAADTPAASAVALSAPTISSPILRMRFLSASVPIGNQEGSTTQKPGCHQGPRAFG